MRQFGMRVISKSRLTAYSLKHADTKDALNTWYKIMRSSSFGSLVEVRAVLPSADLCGDNNRFTCFNIKGNSYRLIVEIKYKWQRVYIHEVLTHAQYTEKYC
jgi:mRNA interferase HigB